MKYRVTGVLLASSLAAMALSASAVAQGLFSGIFGTSADVNLKIAPLAQGSKGDVTINVLAKEGISPRRVYVELRCHETIEIDDYRVAPDPKIKDSQERIVKVRKSEVVASREYAIATNQQYLANSTHEVKGQIELPEGFPFTVKGKFFRVNCEARAGLDLPGNDPNSAWQDVLIWQK